MGNKLYRQTPNSTARLMDFEGLYPIGSVKFWAGSKTGASIPSGWLVCDGSAISRTTYGSLFAVIATKYGVGDGSTTFNLPSATGNVPHGISDTNDSRPTTIATGNQSASHTHNGTSGNQSASHTHNGTSGNQSSGHTHNFNATTGNNSDNHTHDITYNPGEAGNADTTKTSTDQSANHTHNFAPNSSNAVSSHAHNTTTGNQSVDHTHNTTFGNQSASHTHNWSSFDACLLIKV